MLQWDGSEMAGHAIESRVSAKSNSFSMTARGSRSFNHARLGSAENVGRFSRGTVSAPALCASSKTRTVDRTRFRDHMTLGTGDARDPGSQGRPRGGGEPSRPSASGIASPFNFFDLPTLTSAAKLAGGAPQIYGLFEPAPDGKFYAILLARIKSGALSRRRIRPRARLQTGPAYAWLGVNSSSIC